LGRRRTFLKWFGGAVIIVLVAGVAALLSVDHLARLAIESAGSRALGVTTTLDQLSIGVFSGRSSLAGFQVANPEGFQSSYFLRLDSGAVNMSLLNVLHETIAIDQLTLSGIHLNLVREVKQANFSAIIANIRRFEEEIAKQAGSNLATGKQYVIHSVLIRDVHVHVDLLPLGGKLTQLDVPIELIELKDVGAGSSRGENLARIIATIVRALLEAVLDKGESILPPEAMEELSNMLSELKPIETLRAFRNSLQERREQRRQQSEPGSRLFAPLRQRRLEKQ
jgi:hypothetical protein